MVDVASFPFSVAMTTYIKVPVSPASPSAVYTGTISQINSVIARFANPVWIVYKSPSVKVYGSFNASKVFGALSVMAAVSGDTIIITDGDMTEYFVVV